MPKLTSTETIKSSWRRLSKWVKIPLYILLAFAIFCGINFGIATWYIHKHRDEPFQLGTTFISSYAEYFGLDPHETLQAILGDLGMRHLRLVSYWDDIEATKGVYDFSNLDWQMDMAQKYGAKVTLSIGLRQPRWPECHAPTWVDAKNDIWKDDLNAFITAVVNRYKGRLNLESYQLENEYFLNVFGECQTFGADRQRLETEYGIVKSLDPNHPVILSLANNYAFPTGQPVPDEYGVSVYKRVYDYTVTHRYFEYPFPSWYYAARAGLIEMRTGKESVLHELQTEPWGPTGVKEMSIAEQDKTMNAALLTARINYAKKTGFRTVDTWGAEWWYWRKTKLNDPSLWNASKQAVADSH